MATKPDTRDDNGPLEYALTDLIDFERLQRLQDSFAEMNGVASTITDIHGTPITRPSNHSQVCQMIRKTRQGAENCRQSGEYLGREAAREMRPVHRRCLSCGFTDAAAPIVVNGRHLANWLIGQNYIGDVDEERIRQYSREIGAEEQAMVTAFGEMPKISRKRFIKILDFLWLMANEISEIGYLALHRKLESEQLRQARFQLEQHQVELERQVDEKTSAFAEANQQLHVELEARRRTEEELLTQKNLFETMFNAIHDGIVVTNTKREIQLANKGMETTFGYTAKELLGRSARIVYADDEAYRASGRAVFAHNGPTRSDFFDTRYRHRDGREFPGETFGARLYDEHGEWLGNLAIMRDVTARVQREEEKEKFQRHLAQAQKMEAIGTLAEGIAHEVNTPIQYIRGNVEFLAEALRDLQELAGLQLGLVDTAAAEGRYMKHVKPIKEMVERVDLDFLQEETQQAVGESLEGLRRIATIVQAMKEFATSGEDVRKREDLHRLLQNVVTVSRHHWQRQAEMHLDLSREMPAVPLFAGTFRQVILNLILNSAEAFAGHPPGDAEAGGRITISTRREGDHVAISVADNGPGIKKEHLSRIFDPFFSTKEVGSGLGHGLSFVHNCVVNEHGGEISVNSSPGGGAEFVIRLPLTVQVDSPDNS